MKIKKYQYGGKGLIKIVSKAIKPISEVKDSGKELVSQIIKDNSIERLLNTILLEQSSSEQNRFWKTVKAYTPKSIGNGFSMHKINSDLPNGFVADAFGNVRVVPGTLAQQNYIYDALYNNRIDDRIIPMVRAVSKGERENGWQSKNGIMFGGGGIDQSLVIPYFLGDGKSKANKVSNLKYNIAGKFNPKIINTEIGHTSGIKGIQSAIESHEPEKAAGLLVNMLKNPVKSDSYLSELIKNAEAISLKNPGYYDTNKQSAAFEWIRSGKSQSLENIPNIVDSNGNAVVLHYLPEGKVIKFPDMSQWTVRARKSNLSENPEFFKIKSEFEQIAGKPINSDAISTDKVINLLDTEIPGNNIFWSRVGDFHGIKQPLIVSNSASTTNPILIGVKPWDSPIVKVPLMFNQGGIIKAQGGAGKKAIKAISKIAENIKGTNKITDLDKIKNRVKITLSDPEKYWYIGHQTGSGNFDNIAKYGLQTTNGLSGTAIPLSQDFTNTFAKGLTKKFHLSHEGSDGLVIMKFPKIKFPSSDLDDISIRLMDLGESKNFEVPPEYLSFIKKQQLENGGILKAQGGLGKTAKILGKVAKSSAKRMKLPKSQFVSEIKLDSGNYTDAFLNDAVKIAESAMNPGKMSNEALSGVERMKTTFQSDWMKKRLKSLGYDDAQISQYIQDRLAGLDLSKTSVAENLTAIRPLEARTSGALVIKPGVEVGYGQNFNGLGIQPFDQQFIQITKSGNVKDIISHEIGGHGTEKFNFTHDLSGNPIYSKTKLTPLGESFAKSTGLGESYYLNPSEQRARFIVTAQDMAEQGFDPNNYDDFLKFMTANQSTPVSTNAGQTARFYDIKTLWPAFSKAHGIIPIGAGIGLGATTLKENKTE